MRKLKFRTIILLFLPAVLSVSASAETVQAAGELVGIVNGLQNLSLYVRGTDAEQEAASGTASCRIGKAVCRDLRTVSLAQDERPARTRIVIDNSNSIKEGDWTACLQAADRMIRNRASNEWISVATFGIPTGGSDHEDIQVISDYSQDNELLQQAVDSIVRQDKKNYINEVIYEELGAMAEDQTAGYQRLILITDGGEENTSAAAVGRSGLEEQISRRIFPVYIVAAKGNSDSMTDYLRTICEESKGQYLSLDDPEAAAQKVSADESLTVFQIPIPESEQDGQTKNAQLVLADGTALTFELTTPFGEVPAKDTETETGTENVTETEMERGAELSAGIETQAAAETITETEMVTETEMETEMKTSWKKRRFPMVLLLILLFLIVAAAGIVIARMIRNKNEQEEFSDDSDWPPEGQQQGSVSDQTVLLSDDDSALHQDAAGATELLINSHCTYKLILHDRHDPARSFSCDLKNPVVIGRNSHLADITIDYDRSVSGKHCMVSTKGGRFYVTDLGSGNKTKVNGTLISSETEIFSGDVLKLGRVELRAEIQGGNGYEPASPGGVKLKGR